LTSAHQTRRDESEAAQADQRSQSLTPDEAPASELPSGAESASEDAWNTAEPQAGIDALTAYVSEQNMTALADAATVYTTLGRLHLRMEPPNIALAESLFVDAKRSARTPEQYHAAALARAKLLLQTANASKALAVTTEALHSMGDTTVDGLRLRVFQATLQQQTGALQEAEAGFQQVMETALTAHARLGKPALMAYREAGLHLARLYHDADRTDEEATLRDTVRARASALEEQTAVR
jgi:hypothetical protein